MGKIARLARELRRAAATLADADAALSADPGRIGRRIVNKTIYRVLRKLEAPLYLKQPRKPK